MCNPETSPQNAHVAWRKDVSSWTIKARTTAANSTGNIDFDIKAGRFDRAFIVIASHEQKLFMRIGLCSACLEITGTSILLHPVKMRFSIDGIEKIQGAISALEATLSVVKSDRKLKQKPVPAQTQSRRLRYLIAANMAVEGSSLREIGVAIYGESRTGEEWKKPDSRAFKDQIARAKRRGLSLMNGEYRKFLN